MNVWLVLFIDLVQTIIDYDLALNWAPRFVLILFMSASLLIAVIFIPKFSLLIPSVNLFIHPVQIHPICLFLMSMQVSI